MIPTPKRISLSIRALQEPEAAPVQEEVVPTLDNSEEAVAVDIDAVGAALEAEAEAAETNE